TPAELTDRLSRRPSRLAVKVRLPEGLNHMQVARRLEKQQICSEQAFIASVRDPVLLAELEIRAASAEGYLFPATYHWSVNTDARDLVRQLVGEFRRRMARLEARHPKALETLGQRRGWSEHEVVVLASIVEKETSRAEERALVAGVYVNRLTRRDFEPRARLQSDPTAAYGCWLDSLAIPSCTGFVGRVTPAMLRDASNPYNTYRHAGLPPGPISNPGEAALEAALLPAETEYMFFVANDRGGHTFSRTYQEHRRAVHGGR
ncbi:endolytic transglycosylase MltG, partial [Myxococcota bacterium]